MSYKRWQDNYIYTHITVVYRNLFFNNVGYCNIVSGDSVTTTIICFYSSILVNARNDRRLALSPYVSV
jgi:hypothetical protein